jgi:hypothetical protein
MKFFKYIASLGLAIFLSGCMQVQTQVDAYSEIPEDLEPKTIYLVPYKGTSASNLEWKANAKILAQVLKEKGFSVVRNRRDARLTAFFGFGIDRGQQVSTPYTIPQYGVTGYSGANTYGSVYGNTFTAHTTFTPTYGVTGYSSGTITEVHYTRSVSIEMIDNKTRKPVFQARAVSRGKCGSFKPVAAPIISAVLSNFPKGKSGTVTLPLDSNTDC